AGPAGELTADFVADLGQAGAGLQDGDGHGAVGVGARGASVSECRCRRGIGCAEHPAPPRIGGCFRHAALCMSDPHALQDIGWPLDDRGQVAVPEWRECLEAHPQARPARVVEQHRSGYVVAEGPDDSFPVESPAEWQRRPSYRKGGIPPEARAGVGDWVLVERSGDVMQIVALLPRRSAIKRAAAGEHYKQQLIAANVDTVFVVCGLDKDFNPRRIERYLLLVKGSGAQAVVVLTKADHAADVPGAVATIAALASAEVPVRAVDAREPDSVAALRPWLQP